MCHGIASSPCWSLFHPSALVLSLPHRSFFLLTSGSPPRSFRWFYIISALSVRTLALPSHPLLLPVPPLMLLLGLMLFPSLHTMTTFFRSRVLLFPSIWLRFFLLLLMFAATSVSVLRSPCFSVGSAFSSACSSAALFPVSSCGWASWWCGCQASCQGL
jgi:hypothetical protein